MIQVSPELLAALNSASNQPVDVYELYLDSGTLYYSDQTITWGGHNYLAKVQGRSAIQRFSEGEFDRVTITFSNIDRTLASVVLNNDIEGRRLIIRKIDRTVAGDSIVLFHGEMERPSKIDEQTCIIEAKQIVGSIEQEAPTRVFSYYCPFEPGQRACGLAAGTSCDKSWSRCVELGNSNRYGGFRFVPHSGTYQYQETTESRTWYTLGLWKRKKTKTLTGTFSAVDDTPYDVPIPIIYGRVQITGIDIQHADEGGNTDVLAAFCVGKIASIFGLRANQTAVSNWTTHLGELGGEGTQTVDPRFPQAYPYSLVAYAGVTLPSDVKEVDPAPAITAIVQGREVKVFGAGGVLVGTVWTDNPVWCTRDFMTLPEAEGGMGLPEEWFDDATNYIEALYCDELITDTTNDQKIYNPTTPPPEWWEYKRYRSTGVDGHDPATDGPYDDFEPGVDDDTSRDPVPVNVRRFTMNVAIAQAEKAIDILYKKLLPSFRGYITFSKEGKIQIRVERPAPHTNLSQAALAGATELRCAPPAGLAAGDLVLASPLTANAEALKVQAVLADRIQLVTAAAHPHAAGDEVLRIAMAFGDSNIVDGIEYPLSDRQPSTNCIAVKYVDAPAGFEARELRIHDYEHQAKVHRVNKEDLDGSAIDSYFQAWRVGQWRRANIRDLGRFCTFRADIKATLLEIGDTIAITAAEVGMQAVPFRVIELSYEEDDEISIVGQLYSTAVYDDTAPQTTVTVPTIFAPPQAAGAIPGDVQPIGADAFLLTKTEDGTNASLTVEYDPPADITGFAGVIAHWVPDATGVAAAAVPFDYNGDFMAPAGDAARHGKCCLVVPQPVGAAAPGRVALTPKGLSYNGPLVAYGKPGASPSVAVTLGQASGAGIVPPNALRPIGGRPFVLTISEDGINARLDVEYEPPEDLTGFAGITLHWVPDDSEAPAIVNDCDYNGNAAATPDSPARRGRGRVIVPQPPEDAITGRLYATVRGESYKQALVLHGQLGESPSLPVTIDRYGTAVVGYPAITGFTTDPRADPVTGAQAIRVTITYTAPTIGDFRGVRLWRRIVGSGDSSQELTLYGHDSADGQSVTIDWWFQRTNVTAETWEFVVAPYNGFRYGLPVDLGPIDPVRGIEVNRILLNVAAIGAANGAGVTDAAVSGLSVEYTQDGMAYWVFVVSWTNPAADANWFATRMTVQLVDAAGNPAPVEAGAEREVCNYWGAGEHVEHRIWGWPVPDPAAQYKHCRLRLYAVNQALEPTLFSQAWGGQPYYDVLPSVVEGRMRADRLSSATLGDGVQVSGGQLRTRINTSRGVAFVNGAMAVNAGNAITFDTSGRVKVYVDEGDMGDFDVIYGYLRQKRVDLRKAENFNTTEFKLDEIDGKLHMKQLTADKIATGILRVGYLGTTPKPGQIAVYGTSEVLVAWIGQQGSYYGGWFKQLYVAGNDPSTAKMVANGNALTITGADIQVTSPSGTLIVINTTYGFRASYGNLSASFDSSGSFVSETFPDNSFFFSYVYKDGFDSTYWVRVGGFGYTTTRARLYTTNQSKAWLELMSATTPGQNPVVRHQIVAAPATADCFADFYSLRVNGVEVIDANRVLKNVSMSGHTHDDRYYTESEIDALLAGKASAYHGHSGYTDYAGQDYHQHYVNVS